MNKIQCTRAAGHDGDHVACSVVALKHNVLSWEGKRLTGGSAAAGILVKREVERATFPDVIADAYNVTDS